MPGGTMQTFIPDYRLEPEEKNDFIPVCPVCGKECDTLYLDKKKPPEDQGGFHHINTMEEI